MEGIQNYSHINQNNREKRKDRRLRQKIKKRFQNNYNEEKNEILSYLKIFFVLVLFLKFLEYCNNIYN